VLHIINSHVKLLKLLFNNYWNSQRNKDTYFFFFKFYNNFEPKEIWFKLLLLLSKESKKSLKISLILFFESFKSFQANFHDIFISEFLNNEWFFQRSWNWMKSLYSLVFWNTIRTVSKFIDWANWVSCCFLFCLFFTNWFLTKKGSRKKKKKEKKNMEDFWTISLPSLIGTLLSGALFLYSLYLFNKKRQTWYISQPLQNTDPIEYLINDEVLFCFLFLFLTFVLPF